MLGRFFQVIGIPWPDLNDGLFYNDVVKPSDSDIGSTGGVGLLKLCLDYRIFSCLIFLMLLLIVNETCFASITVAANSERTDRSMARLSQTVLRLFTPKICSKVVYRRLPWKESDTPYLFEILYEDVETIALRSRVPLTEKGCILSLFIACEGELQFAAYFADGTFCVERNRVQNNWRLHHYGVKASSVSYAIPEVAQGLYVATSSGKPAFRKVNVLEIDERGEHTLVQVEIQSG
ncbi:RNA pseudouridine synthase 5, partial [Cucurbita argyrosperma subsp. sororia]